MNQNLHVGGGEPPRDRWGRPVIDGVTYRRVSTLAKVLDDQGGLINWAARMTALGLASSPDLLAAVATTNPDDKRKLDELVTTAKDRARATGAATIGTAIHAATVTADTGGNTTALPDNLRVAAAAWVTTLAANQLTPLAAEQFVVCPQVRAAGTFDRLLQGPNRVIIADLKTSQNGRTAQWAALSWAVQLAVYAHGSPWTPELGVTTWSALKLPQPDTTRGLIIHLPQGGGTPRLWSVDLEAGWAAAQLAAQVDDTRKTKPATEIPSHQKEGTRTA